MSSLSAFLNPEVVENKEIIVSKRFKDENGNVVPFVAKALTAEETDELKKKCNRMVHLNGSKGVKVPQLDVPMYMGKLSAACTVFPSLDSAELQDKYKVFSPEELLRKMLLPGEYDAYQSAITELNGFDVSFEDMVDEVKN